MSDPISRFERSLLLVKASWQVLASDGELLILPLLSAVATIAICGMFVGLALQTGAIEALQQQGAHELPGSFYAWLFVFYVVQYFIVFFFNTALVGAAIERLGGGDPTVGSALTLARSRVGAILGYAVISATVGLLLRMIAERLGIIGRFIEAGAGLAWTVTTFLVVPVLAAEGVGPMEAIQKSASLLRKTWGENLIGSASISFAMSIMIVAVIVFGGGAGVALADRGHMMLAIPFFSVTIAVVLALVLVGAALGGIYSAAVYCYAVSGKAPEGFDRFAIRDAFKKKGD